MHCQAGNTHTWRPAGFNGSSAIDCAAGLLHLACFPVAVAAIQVKIAVQLTRCELLVARALRRPVAPLRQRRRHHRARPPLRCSTHSVLLLACGGCPGDPCRKGAGQAAILKPLSCRQQNLPLVVAVHAALHPAAPCRRQLRLPPSLCRTQTHADVVHSGTSRQENWISFSVVPVWSFHLLCSSFCEPALSS